MTGDKTAVTMGMVAMPSLLMKAILDLRSAALRPELGAALEQEVEGLGAVDVAELTPEDWASLPTWPQLRPLEQRRLQAVLLTPLANGVTRIFHLIPGSGAQKARQHSIETQRPQCQ